MDMATGETHALPRTGQLRATDRLPRPEMLTRRSNRPPTVRARPVTDGGHLLGVPRLDIERDSGAYEIGLSGNVRDIRQMLMVFVISSGTALALLQGAKRFGEETTLHHWLRWGALAVLLMGCGTVGLSLAGGAVSDLRRAGAPPPVVRPNARHQQVSRSAALFRLLLGLLVGVAVPAVALYSALS